MTQLSNIRIVDIARKAGVSAGTVDRVIHNRGRVSPEKRELVEKALEEMNYEPNMVARFLATKRHYTIAAVIPVFATGEYWELVHHGMERACDELRRFNISIRYFFFDQHDRETFLTLTPILAEQHFDGVLMAPLLGDPAVALSKTLDESGVPYVYIDANIVGQNNLAYFGSDSFAGGAVAARLLINEVGREAHLFFAHIRYPNRAQSIQMQARQKGFEQFLDAHHFPGQLHQLEVFPNDLRGNIARLRELLVSTEGSLGGIVFNSRVHELVKVVDCLDDHEKQRIRLAGYDAIEANVAALRNKQVSFLLSQRPEIQGYDAVKALGNLFIFQQESCRVNHMPIDILIRENMDFYNNYKL
ncbi:MAG: LacI family DNA-binding transcriptional regulator [Breznakibacter sp.]